MSLKDQHSTHLPAGATGSSATSAALPIHEDEATLEAIARFDELEEDRLTELVSNPSAKKILSRLREVDQWLEAAVAENHGGVAKISAEELYRFGKGRGAEPLSELRQMEVEAFLKEHPEEARWTERLSEPIPAPLDVSPIEDTAPVQLPGSSAETPSIQRVEDLHEPGARRGPRASAHEGSRAGRRAPQRLAPWMKWLPAAAAAVALTMILDRSGPTNAMDGGLPESLVLRSASSAGLLFPRGRVLAPVEGLETYAARPLFEVTAVEGAERYRFELKATTGGAFDEGETVWSAESTSKNATADQLKAGTYEWSAWVTVHGVEKDLGTLSIAVLPPEDAGLLRCASGADSGPSQTREDIRRLHAAGFLSDARSRARGLPPGEARAAYLAEGR